MRSVPLLFATHLPVGLTTALFYALSSHPSFPSLCKLTESSGALALSACEPEHRQQTFSSNWELSVVLIVVQIQLHRPDTYSNLSYPPVQMENCSKGNPQCQPDKGQQILCPAITLGKVAHADAARTNCFLPYIGELFPCKRKFPLTLFSCFSNKLVLKDLKSLKANWMHRIIQLPCKNRQGQWYLTLTVCKNSLVITENYKA